MYSNYDGTTLIFISSASFSCLVISHYYCHLHEERVVAKKTLYISFYESPYKACVSGRYMVTVIKLVVYDSCEI